MYILYLYIYITLWFQQCAGEQGATPLELLHKFAKLVLRCHWGYFISRGILVRSSHGRCVWMQGARVVLT